MDDLTTFKNQNKPKNTLSVFSEEILSLHEDGYSVKQIKIFLTKFKNIKVSTSAIYKFLSAGDNIIETKKTSTKSNSGEKTFAQKFFSNDSNF